MTALVILLQWSVVAQCLCWLALAAIFVRQMRQPEVIVECYDDRVEWVQKQVSEYCQLHYLTEHWMVVKVPMAQKITFSDKLSTLINRYRLIYKDQMTTADYRYLRSRLSVDKLMGFPAQRNESSALK
ncbi:MAG: hypothetical protein KC467_02805 [Marinomonas atlantica]|nr:hypothetical protein [Marinomonas atlantica]